MPDLSKDQYWKVFEKLSDELKETIFSQETAESIFDVCDKNGLEIEEIPKVARYAGRVLFGLLPPDEFQKTLEEEVKIKKSLSQKIAGEINRLVFYPVKPALEELYNIEIAPPVKPTETIPPTEKKPTAPKKDTYREPIE